MKDVTAKVSTIELVNKNVYQIALQVDDLAFEAGQYLMIVLPTGEQVPYSIGSAPHELPFITLFILVSDPESLANKVIQHIQSNESIKIKVPGGDCHLQNGVLENDPEHILLIAGGTGFAQIKSLYEELVARDFKGKVSFYWGVKTFEDTFHQEWLNQAQENPQFSVDLIVNDESEQWEGRTGWLYEAIIADHQEFSNSVAFISGSVGMVYGTFDQLELNGLTKDRCFSDVFAYAPHPNKSKS